MLLMTIVKDEFRLLTFRTPSARIRDRPGAYIAFGLALSWAAGIGRYWDSPDAASWQHLGLGSLAYVFVLALVIWLLVLPLGPRNWSYRNVLLFVALTAPPALVYAIPVEAYFSLPVALAINAGFFAVVALWRVALLVTFLRRIAGLKGYAILVAALLPLTLIVDALALVELQHLVYSAMVGDRDPSGPGRGGAHEVVDFVCMASALATPALLVCYASMAANRGPRPELPELPGTSHTRAFSSH